MDISTYHEHIVHAVQNIRTMTGAGIEWKRTFLFELFTIHPPPTLNHRELFTKNILHIYTYLHCLSIYPGQLTLTLDLQTIQYIQRYIDIYPANMLPYTGAGRSLDDTVTGLLGDLAHKGYHLYMDNFYNSVSRCQVLRSLGTQVCGTMRRQQLRSSSRTMMRRLAVDCL